MAAASQSMQVPSVPCASCDKPFTKTPYADLCLDCSVEDQAHILVCSEMCYEAYKQRLAGFIKNGFQKQRIPVLCRMEGDGGIRGIMYHEVQEMNASNTQQVQRIFDALSSKNASGVHKASVARVYVEENESGLLRVTFAYDQRNVELSGEIATDPVALKVMRARLQGQAYVGIGLTHRTWDQMPNTLCMIQVCKQDRHTVALISAPGADLTSPVLTGLMVMGVIEINPNTLGSGDAQKKMQQLVQDTKGRAQAWPWSAPRV
jgi:hypothetical protein